MELEPIIKKNIPLCIIVVYEFGEDQMIEISNELPLESTINEILKYAEWCNKDQSFINKYNFRTFDVVEYIYLYKIENGIEYKSKNLYLTSIL